MVHSGMDAARIVGSKRVLFLNNKWEAIGRKNEDLEMNDYQNLSQSLSHITGIPDRILHWKPFISASARMRSASVAQRMSWASGRNTSRTEDIAYCLLGIFDINMPMLYGEGHKAFARLQQEIIKSSEDESLFAWSIPPTLQLHHNSLFAFSPDSFAKSALVERRYYTSWIRQSPFMLTDAGVQMDVLLIRPSDTNNKTYLLPLNCETQGRRNAIVLHWFHGNYFGREISSVLDFVDQVDIKRGLNELGEQPGSAMGGGKEHLWYVMNSEGLSGRWDSSKAETNHASGLDPVRRIHISRPWKYDIYGFPVLI